MPDLNQAEKNFILKITGIIEDNISNEQFGVSELADMTGMSRSNLLRRIRKLTDLSASQFIRKIRLENAMEMLKEGSYTVSEVSFKAGFNSTSYFIKCFHDQYGFPPGELSKSMESTDDGTTRVHQLAAIMFTDIEGYTALMQRDETKAVELRKRHREIFEAAMKKYRGRILQYYGDGTLSAFQSAIDAVRCGVEMQLAFLDDPAVPVRIGIHSGDIIFTDDEIIGDGVNIAARIEALAVSGSILISEKVYDEVKNQGGIGTLSLGLFKLKNVDKPVEVFAITNEGLIVPSRDKVGGNTEHVPGPGRSKEIVKPGKLGVRGVVLIVLALLLIYLLFIADIFNIVPGHGSSYKNAIAKKSIAVLPFINDSEDSSNVYIVNGLMESILNNLQKIEDLRVVSRTSVEKYRDQAKLIPEIAEELNVGYVVEGSGQKIGDQILLSIQLIEAKGDKHLWAEQYKREVKDIFDLQIEVAKSIAEKITVIITPEVLERIEKVPTENLAAYDHLLKGLDLFYRGDREGLKMAIVHFKEAITLDEEFARAYADVAIAYYFLDIYLVEKQFSDSISFYADRAIFLDPDLYQGMLAKAYSFMNLRQYERAVPYFERALELNPNSGNVINALADFYANYYPDTQKYLEYALKGIEIDPTSNDSSTISYIYLHISNAFIQSGFVDEALYYVNTSLEYLPGNLFSEYVKAYILYARNRNLKRTRSLLIDALEKDTNRLDILQEVGKICYYQRDYENAYRYFRKFVDMRRALNLDIYRFENAKIGVVFSEMGKEEEAASLFNDYKLYAEHDRSVYRNQSLAAYYAYFGEDEKALEYLQRFSEEENYHMWTILFLEIDPLFENVKHRQEFKAIIRKLKEKFWERHEEIRNSLENEGLI